MIIAHSQRFILVKTRKTAGTSVELALSPLLEAGDIAMPLAPDEDRVRQIKQGVQVRRLYGIGRSGLPRELKTHSSLQAAYDLLGPRIHNYRVVSLCRNPWDKAVSHFFWSMRQFGVKSLSFREQRAAFIQFIHKKGPRRWYDRWLGRMPPKALDGNYRLYLIDGQPRLDFVIRYEFLQADLESLAEYLSLTAVPRLEGVTAKTGLRPGSVPGWVDYYDNATRELVAEHSRGEIALFGYDFEGQAVPAGPRLMAGVNLQRAA